MDLIDIKGLNKAEILVALHNNSRSSLSEDATLTVSQAEEHLKSALELHGKEGFYYINGRVIEVFLSNDELDPSLYDGINGQGAALNAIKHLFTNGITDKPIIEEGIN